MTWFPDASDVGVREEKCLVGLSKWKDGGAINWDEEDQNSNRFRGSSETRLVKMAIRHTSGDVESQGGYLLFHLQSNMWYRLCYKWGISISALKFYLKWHIFSVDNLCKWWSQDLNPTQPTTEPKLSLLYSAPGISVDKWKAHTLLDKPSEVWNVYAIQNCSMTSTENVSFNPYNSLQLPLLSSFYSCGNWGTKSLRVSKRWI